MSRYFPFTKSESTEAKYTVGKAVECAKYRLAQRSTPMCMNAVGNRDLKEKITLKEVNRIADQIVRDSQYYDNGSSMARRRS